MINLVYAFVATLVVYALTILTEEVQLPLFTVYLVFTISYMSIKEIKYEVEK